MSSKINASTSGVGGLVSSADNSGILELQSAGITKFTVSQEGAYGTLRLETAKNATGTAVDFTNIPSWVKRITVLFAGVSTNGTSGIVVQIGNGSVDTTGYLSGGMIASASAVLGTSTTVGFMVDTGGGSTSAASVRNGKSTIEIYQSNSYICTSILGFSSGSIFSSFAGGSKTLSGSLDRLRITTINGTDTFDAGIINLLLEG